MANTQPSPSTNTSPTPNPLPHPHHPQPPSPTTIHPWKPFTEILTDCGPHHDDICVPLADWFLGQEPDAPCYEADGWMVTIGVEKKAVNKGGNKEQDRVHLLILYAFSLTLFDASGEHVSHFW